VIELLDPPHPKGKVRMAVRADSRARYLRSHRGAGPECGRHDRQGSILRLRAEERQCGAGFVYKGSLPVFASFF